jgi:hypothetical protein
VQLDDTHKKPTTISIRQSESRIRPITLSKNQPTQPEHEVPGSRIGCRWSGRWCNPTGKSQSKGVENHSPDLLAHSWTKGFYFIIKSLDFRDTCGIYTRNNPPCSLWMDLWVSGVMLREKPPRTEISNSLVWLLGSCAVFTKSVITIYWEVQWTCVFLYWKVDFNTVSWNTHGAPELSGFKSYDQIIIQVRTCPNWSVWTCLNWILLDHPWSELIHLFLLLCYI